MPTHDTSVVPTFTSSPAMRSCTKPQGGAQTNASRGQPWDHAVARMEDITRTALGRFHWYQRELGSGELAAQS